MCGLSIKKPVRLSGVISRMTKKWNVCYRSAQQKSSTIQAIRQCLHQQPQRLHWGSQGTKVKAASTLALPSLDRQTSHNMSAIAESSTDRDNHHHTSHSSLPS